MEIALKSVLSAPHTAMYARYKPRPPCKATPTLLNSVKSAYFRDSKLAYMA